MKRSKDITEEYSAFKLLNLKTSEVAQYPYIKGVNGQDSELKAIKEAMELTGQPRQDFMIHGLVRREEESN